MNGHGGGTNIFEGLKIAEQQANNFLNQADADVYDIVLLCSLWHRCACFNPGPTVQTAENIKNGPSGGKVTICRVPWSSWEALMKGKVKTCCEILQSIE